jgi:DNA-binding SARP family transcriptional activator/Tfp pilus assembly protein PilF
LEARDGTGTLLVPPSRKQRVLLAVLLLHANQPVGRDRLVDLLWGAAPPTSAVANLHTYVARLRKLLATGARQVGHQAVMGVGGADPGGPPRLRTEGGGYALAVAPGELDLLQFEQLVKHGRQALADGQHAVAAERLTRALGLWRGRPLEDLPVPDDLTPALAGLEDQHLTVVEDCVDARLALGQHTELAAEVRALTKAHPLRERLWTQRMLAEYRAGRQADALASYRQLYRLLDDQLGIRPGEPVQRLHLQILAADAALNPPPSAVTLEPRPAPQRSPSTQRQLGGAEQSAGPATPNQLPIGIRGFAGRENELAQLDRILEADGQQPASAVICAVSGTAGVGKTALAVHWAHHAADRFPDGQLYVNLRGFDPDGPGMAPADAVRGFLDALGAAPERIPADLPAQSGLYRSLLAHLRVLVVLDNARDADQVHPLLPGGTGCLTLVTSRNQLAGLVATEGAYPVTVKVPTLSEARAMLANRLGHQRIATETAAVDEIIAGCARLPLALAIVAARAAIHPEFPLAALANELHHSRNTLDAFTADDTTNLRAVLSWSYRALTPAAARLFRLLGLHPGPDITTPAAASLAGLPPPQLPPLLTELTRIHLISEHQPGHYTFHDLLRAYAVELARTHDHHTDRRAATHRVLDHYLHTAHAAALLLHPQRDRLTLTAPQPGVSPEHLTDDTQALAWFTDRHHTLLAAITHAADNGFDTHSRQLPWTMVDYLQRRGHWHDWAATQHIALHTSQHLDDRAGQGDAHRLLGFAYARMGRDDDAASHLHQALDLFAQLGDRTGQASTHLGFGWLMERRSHYRKALDHARQALGLYRATGQRLWQARALNAVGWCHSQLGHHRQALTCCRQALDLLREIGDRRGEANTWHSLGQAHHHLAHHQQAITCFQRAVALFRQDGDRYYEADVLAGLGDAHLAAADHDAAGRSWRQALHILDELEHPDAENIRTRLKNLDNLQASVSDGTEGWRY